MDNRISDNEMIFQPSPNGLSYIVHQAKMSGALNLTEIKKEQRRVAALLGHEVKSTTYNYGDIRNITGGINLCVCSGEEVAKNICSLHKNKKSPRGFPQIHQRNSLYTKRRRRSIDSADLHKLKRQSECNDDMLTVQSISPECRSPSLIKGLPNHKVHGTIRGHDIHQFDYRTLNHDVITNELGGPNSLPGIYHNLYRNSQKGRDVPDNSPIQSARKRTNKIKLPRINTDDDNDDILKGAINTKLRKPLDINNNSSRRTGEFNEDNMYDVTMKNETEYCSCCLITGVGFEDRKTESLFDETGTSLASAKKVPDATCNKSDNTVTRTGKESNADLIRQNDNTNLGIGSKSLQHCLKCGKLIKDKADKHSTNTDDQNLQRFFDPHAALRNDDSFVPQGSFHENTMDSFSSASFVRITDELAELESDIPEYTNKRGDTYMSDKSDKKRKKKTRKDSIMETSGESSEDDPVDKPEYQYNIKRHKPQQIKLDSPRKQIPIEIPVNQQSFETEVTKLTKKKSRRIIKVNSDIYHDGHREAYIKALAMAQIPKLPHQPWMLSSRISKSNYFSYFEPFPVSNDCDVCGNLSVQKLRKEQMAGKFKPMKHVFGKLDVNDFYPGGKRNPLEMREKYDNPAGHG